MGKKRADAKKIEKAAVLAVGNLIQPCARIDHKFHTDDKNVLVDGTLELYRSSALTKEDLIDRIDVQIKGSMRKLRLNSRNFVKYTVDIIDLKRFRDTCHGVLFFYVAVGENQGGVVGNEVFYAQLLPYDINKILKDTKAGQKTVNIRVCPFPTEPKEIERLVSAFHADQEKQLRSEIGDFNYPLETQRLPSDIKSVSFSPILFPGEDVTSLAAYRNGVYIYGDCERGSSIVIGKIEDVSSFAKEQDYVVRSGDFELTTHVAVGECEKGRSIEFEGIRFVVSEPQVSFSYSITGDFRCRYNTARFAVEFIKTGLLYLDGKVVLRVAMGEVGADQLKRLEDAIEAHTPIVEMLDTLAISAAWNPAEMSGEEIDSLNCMYYTLIKKENLLRERPGSPLVHFDINGAQVYAIASKVGEGTYRLYDIFSEQVPFVFGEPDDRAENRETGFDPVPPMFVIGKEGYKRLVNLVPEKLDEAFNRFPATVGNQSLLNAKLLEMLRAYDEGCMRPDALLACAAILARRLYELDVSSCNAYLNVMQVMKRRRELEDAEKDCLRDMAIDGEQMYVKAATHALLDNTDMANKCLNRCSEEEKSFITDCLIARFFG